MNKFYQIGKLYRNIYRSKIVFKTTPVYSQEIVMYVGEGETKTYAGLKSCGFFLTKNNVLVPFLEGSAIDYGGRKYFERVKL